MQKYQVFINDHLLSIVEKLESNQQFHSEFYLKRPGQKEIVILIDWLLSEPEVMKIGLISKEPKQLWEFFQQQFVLIKAAGGLVKNKSGKILFIRRLGKWDLPKGKMEQGEEPTATALREVQEECGISKLQIGKELPSTFHVYRHKGELVLKQTYWFEMNYSGEEELVPQKEEGIEKVVWVMPDKVQEQLSETYASLKPMIKKLS